MTNSKEKSKTITLTDCDLGLILENQGIVPLSDKETKIYLQERRLLSYYYLIFRPFIKKFFFMFMIFISALLFIFTQWMDDCSITKELNIFYKELTIILIYTFIVSIVIFYFYVWPYLIFREIKREKPEKYKKYNFNYTSWLANISVPTILLSTILGTTYVNLMHYICNLVLISANHFLEPKTEFNLILYRWGILVILIIIMFFLIKYLIINFLSPLHLKWKFISFSRILSVALAPLFILVLQPLSILQFLAENIQKNKDLLWLQINFMSIISILVMVYAVLIFYHYEALKKYRKKYSALLRKAKFRTKNI